MSIHVSDFRLQVYKLVAEHKNYSMAAKILCISQPAVYKHIRELEAKYRVVLIERHGPRIALTPAGERFLTQCNKILSQYEKLKSFMYAFVSKEQQVASIRME